MIFAGENISSNEQENEAQEVRPSIDMIKSKMQENLTGYVREYPKAKRKLSTDRTGNILDDLDDKISTNFEKNENKVPEFITKDGLFSPKYSVTTPYNPNDFSVDNPCQRLTQKPDPKRKNIFQKKTSDGKSSVRRSKKNDNIFNLTGIDDN